MSPVDSSASSSGLLERGVLQVRAPGVSFYVLRDEEGLVVVDTGFVGGLRALHRSLRKAGWQDEEIRGILLTHGHLDHILNVKRLARETDAWVAVAENDISHCQGRPIYSGWSRVAGWLEKLGRSLFAFESFQPDRVLREGEELAIWRGLRVVSLPGHTKGHVGFYCEREKLLFCGDLFASMGPLTHLPPPIFNDSSAENRASIAQVLSLELAGILPSHCDRAQPREHLRRLRRLAQKRSL